MQKPVVIRYSNEEDSSNNDEFLKVMGVVSKYSKPSKKKGQRPKKRIEASSYVDFYYI